MMNDLMKDKAQILLIIGLGNFGHDYELTRHNAGFICINHIAASNKVQFQEKSIFNADIAIIQIKSDKIILAKPRTYINLSGKTVGAIANYYKIKSEQILILHDDIDIKLGEIRFKQGGSSGGHNGLKSLDQHIGINYYRLRIGISRPDNIRQDVSDYVLSKFKPLELKVIEHMSDYVSAHIYKISNTENSKIFNQKFDIDKL